MAAGQKGAIIRISPVGKSLLPGFQACRTCLLRERSTGQAKHRGLFGPLLKYLYVGFRQSAVFFHRMVKAAMELHVMQFQPRFRKMKIKKNELVFQQFPESGREKVACGRAAKSLSQSGMRTW